MKLNKFWLYALLITAILTLNNIFKFSENFNTALKTVFSILAFVVPIILLIQYNKEKKYEMGNNFAFGKAFKNAFKLAIVGFVLSYFVGMVYDLAINPEGMETKKEIQLEATEKVMNMFSNETIEAEYDKMEDQTAKQLLYAPVKIFSGLFGLGIIAAIYALIAAAFTYVSRSKIDADLLGVDE